MRAHHPVLRSVAAVELYNAVASPRAADMHQHRVARDDTVIAPVILAEFTAVHDVRFRDIVPLIGDMRLNPRDAA